MRGHYSSWGKLITVSGVRSMLLGWMAWCILRGSNKYEYYTWLLLELTTYILQEYQSSPDPLEQSTVGVW